MVWDSHYENLWQAEGRANAVVATPEAEGREHAVIATPRAQLCWGVCGLPSTSRQLQAGAMMKEACISEDFLLLPKDLVVAFKGNQAARFGCLELLGG